MIMAIPGFDLIRVSILRLAEGRHMFEPDNQHIHHLLLKKHNLIFVNILIQSNIIFPILIYYLYENFLVSVSLSILSYLIMILYSKKSN